MPKKVITRRQRKAAEARRDSETNTRNPTDAQLCHTVGLPAANTLDVKPSSRGVKPETKTPSKLPVAKVSGTRTTQQQQEQQAAGGAEQNSESKTTVTIIVKDKTTQSDKKAIDLLVDENNDNKVTNGEPGTLLPPPQPNDQGSFSKSLTRRAVATFTKIQKLSKVFNKKMNYKAPPATVAEPINLPGAQLDETVKTAHNGPSGSENQTNKTCSCEFCKVVLNQLLTGKNRSNEKKVCKNSNRRLPNHLDSASPGHNNDRKQQYADTSCEDCNVQSPSVATRRRIIQMLERKEKLLEKDVLKKIKQLNKQKTNKTLMEENLVTRDNADAHGQKPSLQTKFYGQVAHHKLAKSAQLSQKTIPQHVTVAATSSAAAAPKTNEFTTKTLDKHRVNLTSAIQQLSVDPAYIPPPRMIGNTGYLVLMGTNAQLATQLTSLAARHVNIRNYVLLEPGVTDKVEQQLVELEINREEILYRMRDKHNMMSICRQRRFKEPSKYT